MLHKLLYVIRRVPTAGYRRLLMCRRTRVYYYTWIYERLSFHRFPWALRTTYVHIVHLGRYICTMAPETFWSFERSQNTSTQKKNRNRIRHSFENLAAVYSFIFNCFECSPMKFNDFFILLPIVLCTSETDLNLIKYV